jgi:hypothetical protein
MEWGCKHLGCNPKEDLMKTTSTVLASALLICMIFSAAPEASVAGLVEEGEGGSCVKGGTFQLLATITGNFEYEMLGTKALCFGDFNGDGYGDLMYTAGNYTDYPKVWVLLGAEWPFDTIPDIKLTYEPPYTWNAKFAEALWTGDLNFDGCDDVIISNPLCFKSTADGRAEGREIFIYFGSKKLPTVKYPDIVIPCPEHVANELYEFGMDLCTVNFSPGMRRRDIVVGCPGRATVALKGKLFVFLWPDYTEYVELPSPLPGQYGDRLGYSVTVSDFNRDGIDEIVAGAYAHYGEWGAVVVWDAYGNYLCHHVSSDHQGRFGWDVSSGDVTDDQYPDLIVSAYRAYPNKVYISYGHSNWGYSSISFDQTFTALENAHYDFFSISLSYGGDINKDGIGDVLVGACQDGESGVGDGYAAIFKGGDGLIDNEPDHIVDGDRQYDCAFGYETNAKAGDMTGDGYSEVAVSAPYYDEGGKRSVGKIYIYGRRPLLVVKKGSPLE